MSTCKERLPFDFHKGTAINQFYFYAIARGIEQDRENFQNILNCISCYEEIHGICVLLKPNNSKLNIMFEFCIKELLTHLHKGAANNIVFLFTNVRNTFYTPGTKMQLF